jgi:hypothetical protein
MSSETSKLPDHDAETSKLPPPERLAVEGRRLGRLPAKSTRKALMFADFFKYLKLPKASNCWTRKQPIPPRTYGNDALGDCTRAKQAVAATRMERLEQKKTIAITDDEIKRVYLAMTARLYGGGDVGAFEDDALNEWRNPETTFSDTAGHRYTIDAYLRIDAFNQDEMRAGLALAGAKGIAVCLNLPAAWQDDRHFGTAPPGGMAPVGEWLPGTWGGHSMWAHDYTADGIRVDHTWNRPPGLVVWDAAAIYLDEAHLVIDSIDVWRTLTKGSAVGRLKLADVVDAVNGASSISIGG